MAASAQTAAEIIIVRRYFFLFEGCSAFSAVSAFSPVSFPTRRSIEILSIAAILGSSSISGSPLPSSQRLMVLSDTNKESASCCCVSPFSFLNFFICSPIIFAFIFSLPFFSAYIVADCVYIFKTFFKICFSRCVRYVFSPPCFLKSKQKKPAYKPIIDI